MAPRRFTPYARPVSTTSSGGLPAYRLRELQVELDQCNELGVPMTFDAVTSSWIPWQRPIRVMNNGSMVDVAASGFHNIKDGYIRPQCPHSADPQRAAHETEMSLNVKRLYRGRTVDFFRVPPSSHLCNFVVVVPPLKEPLYVQTPEQIAEQMAHQMPEDAADTWENYSYDFDHLSSSQTSSSSSSAEVASMLAPSPTSSQTELSPGHGTPHLTASGLFVNPRVPPIHYSPTRSIPTPRPSYGIKTKSSFFADRVAHARASSNTMLIFDVLSKHAKGTYQTSPVEHPAANLDDTHYILEPYDERVFPGCTERTFENVEYLFTSIGRVIQEFNSTLGVPSSAFNAMVEYKSQCDRCNCIFSINGFNLHLDNGTCRNCNDTRHVSPVHPHLDDIANISMRTFSGQPPTPIEFLDSPIGAAYIEWNSRLGVPEDVWAVISTAYVHCDECNLRRSFNGDHAHRDTNGRCADVGQDWSVIVEKGKARDLGPLPGATPAASSSADEIPSAAPAVL